MAIGVWSTQWTHSASGWHFPAAVRRTTSAYDHPVGTYRDDAGHFYVLYRTGDADVTE